jgi:hypothetical protein
MLDRSLDLFHPAHAPSAPVNGISGNNSLMRGSLSCSQLSTTYRELKRSKQKGGVLRAELRRSTDRPLAARQSS